MVKMFVGDKEVKGMKGGWTLVQEFLPVGAIVIKDPEPGRPCWEEYFVDLLHTMSKRATCSRGSNACLITNQDNDILSFGYVGSPHGQPHCDTDGHVILRIRNLDTGEEREHCIRTIHAEQNAIALAAKRGVALKDSILYTLLEPCYYCAKLIVQCGVIKVISKFPYKEGNLTRELFDKSSIAWKVNEMKKSY